MKIFLTGGTGFIGKNFCNLVAKKGDFIYAVSRKIKLILKKILNGFVVILAIIGVKNYLNQIY